VEDVDLIKKKYCRSPLWTEYRSFLPDLTELAVGYLTFFTLGNTHQFSCVKLIDLLKDVLVLDSGPNEIVRFGVLFTEPFVALNIHPLLFWLRIVFIATLHLQIYEKSLDNQTKGEIFFRKANLPVRLPCRPSATGLRSGHFLQGSCSQ